MRTLNVLEHKMFVVLTKTKSQIPEDKAFMYII
jgi:hypothetical protein